MTSRIADGRGPRTIVKTKPTDSIDSPLSSVYSSSHRSSSGRPITDKGSGLIGTRYLSLARIAACVKIEIVGGQSMMT